MDQPAHAIDPSETRPMHGPGAALSDTAPRLSAVFDALQREVEEIERAAGQYEARAAALDQRERAIEEHARQLSEREQHLAERHNELNEASRRLVEEAGAWKEREESLLSIERGLREREEALSAREAALAQRERSAEAGGERSSSDGAHGDAALRLRRERLRRQRALLTAQAEKLLRAKEAIAQRAAEVERARAAVAPRAAAPAATALPERAARGRRGGVLSAAGIGAGALMSSCAVAVSCAAAWWAAGLISPPEFSASARIAMERSGEATHGARESWAAFMLGLSTDPRLMEQASTRLRLRGYAELGTPTDLRRHLEERFTIEEGAPGELTLTLRGPGRARTERVLDAVAGAMVTAANDGRERRLDSAVSVMPSAASAGEAPTRDDRTRLFAVLAAGLSALSLAVGLAGAGLVARGPGLRESKAAALDEDGGEERWSV